MPRRTRPREAARALPVLAAAGFVVCSVTFSRGVRADEQGLSSARSTDAPPEVASEAAVSVAPPPLDIPYLQYGFSLTSEFVASAGKMCASGDQNCILGSGGGVAIRIGRRAASPWYFGGAYELSKQDPASLYRFATLQQLRGEARYYVSTGLDTQPYATVGFGIAAYGNEWTVDTWGPMGQVGVGAETQLSRRTVVGLTLTYRVLGLGRFVDSSGNDRATSVAQLLGFEVTIEQRDPLIHTP